STSGLLGYEVQTEKCVYTVYVNCFFDPIEIPNTKKETVLAHRATAFEETIQIQAFGALILR
ncbi:MAG: hypothetical protein AB1Z19_07910, partial [Eubacteriales bacterium]